MRTRLFFEVLFSFLPTIMMLHAASAHAESGVSATRVPVYKDPYYVDAKGRRWARVGETMTWEQAENACQGLQLAEFDDWRLPTPKEVQDFANLPSHDFFGALDVIFSSAHSKNTVSAYYLPVQDFLMIKLQSPGHAICISAPELPDCRCHCSFPYHHLPRGYYGIKGELTTMPGDNYRVIAELPSSRILSASEFVHDDFNEDLAIACRPLCAELRATYAQKCNTIDGL